MLLEEIEKAKEDESPIRMLGFENESACILNGRKLEFDQVQFVKCQLAESNFEAAEFIGVTFDGCNLSNCHFRNAYFKDCIFNNCKMDGSNLGSAVFKNVKMKDNNMVYCNFVSSLWDDMEVSDEINACSIVVPVEIDGELTSINLKLINDSENEFVISLIFWHVFALSKSSKLTLGLSFANLNTDKSKVFLINGIAPYQRKEEAFASKNFSVASYFLVFSPAL